MASEHTLPQLLNSTPSKERLHGKENLKRIVKRPIPEDFNPDEISWVRPRIGITDWEGACEAIALNHYVITVAPEIKINSDKVMGLRPFDPNFLDVLDDIADKIEEVLENTERSVVLHCAMGMERAPLAAVWYLHNKEGMTITKAYKEVFDARAIACDRQMLLQKGQWTFD